MGFVTMPFMPKLSAGLASVADATAVAVPGGVYFHKTSANKWSVLQYYQANATIASVGLGLVRPAAASAPYVLTTAGTGDVNSYALRGISAAVVNNTGYFSFCYKGGYVPDIVFGSAASGALNGLSGSNAGQFSQYSSAASTVPVGSANQGKPFFFPVLAHDVTTIAGSVASGTIVVQLW